MKPGRYRKQALILRKTNFGEADLIVSFFTREDGKIDGMAKYGRKSVKRFGSIFGTMGLIELEYKIKLGRDLAWLEKGELVRPFAELSSDVWLLALAGQSLELVDAFCQPGDPSPEIFSLLLWCLDRLDQGRWPEEYAFIFKLKLLSHVGFRPNLSACALCGQPPQAAEPGGLAVEQQGYTCLTCAPGGIRVQLGTIKIMNLIQNLDLARLDRIRITESARQEAEPFLLAFIRHILGRDLKTARFLEKLHR